MSKEEVVDIFDDKYLIDEKSGEQIDLDQFNDQQKSFAKKVLEDTTKFIADSASETGMAFTFPASTGIMIFNLASQIAEGPEIPDRNPHLPWKPLSVSAYSYGISPMGLLGWKSV